MELMQSSKFGLNQYKDMGICKCLHLAMIVSLMTSPLLQAIVNTLNEIIMHVLNNVFAVS